MLLSALCGAGVAAVCILFFLSSTATPEQAPNSAETAVSHLHGATGLATDEGSERANKIVAPKRRDSLPPVNTTVPRETRVEQTRTQRSFAYFTETGAFREAKLIAAFEKPDFREVVMDVERNSTGDEQILAAELFGQLSEALKGIALSKDVACGGGVCAVHFRDFDERHMDAVSKATDVDNLGPRIIAPVPGGRFASEFKIIYSIKKTADGSISVSTE